MQRNPPSVWLLLIVSLLTACSKPSTLSPEARLYSNFTGYTFVGDSLTAFTGLVVDSGRVVATGPAPELALAYPGIEIVDLEGRYLLPGLTDAHGHVMGLGRGIRQVDLVGTQSLEDLQQRVAAYARENPTGWVVGRGWNQELWPTRKFPTAADLDRVVPDRPVVLQRVDGHALVANTAALKAAGLLTYRPDPQGGTIVRTPTGQPTGLLIDRAMDALAAIIPTPTFSEDSLALELALEHLSRLGLTSVHDAGIDSSTFELYRQFAQRQRLSPRIYAMIGGVGRDFEFIAANGPLGSYADDALSVRSVKLYADGALGSRGAALLAPYSDAYHTRGLLFQELQALIGQVEKAVRKGFQVNIHAIGDAANRQVLDAYAAVDTLVQGPDQRHRIEHAQMVAPEDIPRFKALGIIASMQPTHATSDKNMAEDRLGASRMQGAYAWQTFLQQGTVVAAGSDFPVEGANPFWGLHAAVTRQDTTGMPPGGWYPSQRLTRAQALRAFTLDAAYAAHQETALGSLEPGKWADFIVVDRDYFRCPEQEIWQIAVIQTFVAGKPVFSRK